MELLRILVCIKFRLGNTLRAAGTLKSAGQLVHLSDNDFKAACSCFLELCVMVWLCRSEVVVQMDRLRWYNSLPYTHGKLHLDWAFSAPCIAAHSFIQSTSRLENPLSTSDIVGTL
jgi:hypothetical protein